MEVQLASGFLPLLFLIWLPTGTVSQTAESVFVKESKLKIWSEDLTVCVEWYKPEGPEMRSQTNTMALGENCMNLSPCKSAAHMGVCEFRVIITGINSTDTGKGTQKTPPRCCPPGLQTNVTEEKIWTGLSLVYIFFGLVVGTLICTPVLGFLLWQCRRNRTGKLTSRKVAEVDQLSMEAPVTGTEDLTYANLKFEKKEMKGASSNIIYTEIKPPQQKQSGRDASAASTAVNVSPSREGK